MKGGKKMRKLPLTSALALSTLTLTSCKVNWFGESFDAPWYVIAIPVAIIAIAGYFILMNTTFICPDCNTEFKPKWYQLSVTVHFGNKRLVKCPKCGKKGFFERKK